MLSVNIGPLATSVDRLLLLVAVAVAMLVGALLGRQRGVHAGSTVINLALVALVAARIGFVLRYWQEYRADWLGMLDIRDGGFDPVTGVLAALTAAGIVLWRSPALRKPLAAALFAGALTWGVTAYMVTLVDRQSRALPAVALQTMEGAPTDLRTLGAGGGRPTVVNLWAAWCPPCRREMPVLEQAQREHPDMTFVFVNQGEGPEQIRTFLRQFSLDIDNVVLDRGGALGRTLGSTALPTTLFYDADGRLVDSHLGELSPATLARGMERLRRPGADASGDGT